jgi:hypothetical protein
MLALGLNFSHQEAARLGLSPNEGLRDLLAELRPKHLRLSLYWDRISPEPGTYDLTDIQNCLDAAQRQGCSVLLTIGFKPQRHPTLAIPPWMIGASSERLTAGLVLMLERAVALLADYSAIDAWEIEFLPYLAHHQQPKDWRFEPAHLRREVAVLHEVDARHRPVVVSHPAGIFSNTGWLKALSLGDILGGALSLSARGTLPLRRISLQAHLASRFDRQLWITELQWYDETGYSISSLTESLQTLTAAGVNRAYLCGTEAWAAQASDKRPDCWREVRELIRTE